MKKTKKKKVICVGCKEPIHPKRLKILPNAIKCVKCSTTSRKAGITITQGEGDHTYNETIIMEHEEFVLLKKREENIFGKRKDDFNHPDEDIEIPKKKKNEKKGSN